MFYKITIVTDLFFKFFSIKVLQYLFKSVLKHKIFTYFVFEYNMYQFIMYKFKCSFCLQFY